MQPFIFGALWLTVCSLIALLGAVLLQTSFYSSFILTALVLLVSDLLTRKSRRIRKGPITPVLIATPPEGGKNEPDGR
jgi:membrane protein implicated in regulation of membrane protease activity